MKISFYRQSAITLKDGVTVYSGEDARPYVDGSLIMVADGLGGTGAARHLSVDKGMFDSESVIPTLFKDTDIESLPESFKDYVKGSFVELYDLKNVYDAKHSYALKKSSYFGSRIVCSKLLYRFLKDKKFNPDTLFDGYSACADDECKQAYLSLLGEKLTAAITEDIVKSAEYANLILETGVTARGKLKLLATTLCGTLYREHEDSVEAIYFMVGDSRPYFWNESDGLSQVIEEAEGADGAMDSSISTSGGFSVLCKYFEFKKPCVLFNASDGSFESGKFISPMAFEKLLLEAITENDSIEAVEARLISDFDTYGTHDDSSTLAMRCFGYKSFEEFKAVCANRLEAIKEKYISKMDELLTENYVYVYKSSSSILAKSLEELKEGIAADGKAREYCAKCIASGSYPEGYGAAGIVTRAYSEKMTAIRAEIADCEEHINSERAQLRNIISENFVKFVPFMERKPKPIATKVIDREESKYTQAKNEYMRLIQDYQTALAGFGESVQRMLELIDSLGEDIIFNGVESGALDGIKAADEFWKKLFDFIKKVKNSAQQNIVDMRNAREAYIKKNTSLADSNRQQLEVICDRVIAGRIELTQITCFWNDTVEQMSVSVEKIRELRARVKVLRGEMSDAASDECVSLMFGYNLEAISVALIESESVGDEKLLAKMKAVYKDYREQCAEIEDKAKLQEALFADYDSDYRKYM